MNRDVEFVLREALDELPVGPPPVELAALSLARGRRIRRNRWLSAGVAVVAAVAVTVVPYQIIEGLKVPHPAETPADSPKASEPAPTPTPTPTARPNLIPATSAHVLGEWRIAGWRSGDWEVPSIVYSAADNAYRPVPYMSARRSPTGTRILVERNSPGAQSGILDPAKTGKDAVTWLDNVRFDHAEWSPDGSRILSTIDGDGSVLGFTITDPESARTRNIRVVEQACGRFCAFTWHPDGRRVVLTTTDESGTLTGLNVYPAPVGAEGVTVAPETLPVRGFVGAYTAWSPDGRFVVADTTATGDPQVFEAATGRVVFTVPGRSSLTTYWTGPGGILTWAEGADGRGHFTGYGIDGRPGGSTLVPEPFGTLYPVTLERLR
ncbi:hypothetical protein Lfu02_23380 [Longispora fulva]|uniref:WD40 repeat protein n=1 Tax=Longispora fulva TaxID=619741 RepID=A0A8J7KYU9_9ACTN|nr:hypothetical protein [Longispora fulva]MBG6139652.1 hypothetical protein [Longispora fulva]GIG57966.1 hypothetical protein Lfu02_23380 [Longispora fulva]